jgi:hypothetical protein
MPLSSWLFIKNGESIWIERPYGFSMVVAGPGNTREQHDFPNEEAVEKFQIDIGERLTNNGWFLWGFDRDRRTARDRRATARNTPERRQVAAESRAR